MLRKFTLLCLALVALCSCGGAQEKPVSKFISVENGQFIRDGKPYRYIGANMWYGAILGSTGEGGNRERLLSELDELKAMGVDNLRVLVGSDGERGVQSKVEPTLQKAPGVYNDTIFDGLDYLLSEMRKRDMVAVLYLNNSWEWSGGYGQYLDWAGYGTAVQPSEGWLPFQAHVTQFYNSEKAQQIFAQYVEDVITRTNRYTTERYVDDPTIMSWQIGNEPRPFSKANKEPFAQWLSKVSAQIKSLDSNHMVSTGNEGLFGCESDIALFERIHGDKNVDYANIHIWPKNWGWVTEENLVSNVGEANDLTKEYIDAHMDVLKRIEKPLVIEEFGYCRDGFKFTKESATTARDSYYKHLFALITDKDVYGGYLAGCNFWAWGGTGEIHADRNYWRVGDDYTGDPAQEQQGLYSVFSTDNSTVEIIKAATSSIE